MADPDTRTPTGRGAAREGPVRSKVTWFAAPVEEDS